MCIHLIALLNQCIVDATVISGNVSAQREPGDGGNDKDKDDLLEDLDAAEDFF